MDHSYKDSLHYWLKKLELDCEFYSSIVFSRVFVLVSGNSGHVDISVNRDAYLWIFQLTTATTSHICILSNMYSVAVHRLIVVSSSCYLLLCTSYVPLFYLSKLIEDTAAAAIVCHPPPPSGGDTRSPSSLFDCCVIVMVCFCLCHRSDVCSKRTSANLIIAIPLLIAKGNEEVT